MFLKDYSVIKVLSFTPNVLLVLLTLKPNGVIE